MVTETFKDCVEVRYATWCRQSGEKPTPRGMAEFMLRTNVIKPTQARKYILYCKYNEYVTACGGKKCKAMTALAEVLQVTYKTVSNWLAHIRIGYTFRPRKAYHDFYNNKRTHTATDSKENQ